MPYASAPVIWYLVGSSVIVAVALVAVPFVGLPVLEARLRRNGPKYGLTNVGTPQPRHPSGNAARRHYRSRCDFNGPMRTVTYASVERPSERALVGLGLR